MCRPTFLAFSGETKNIGLGWYATLSIALSISGRTRALSDVRAMVVMVV